MEKIKRIILADADLLSHFITADEAESIHHIFLNNFIYLLDKVHVELQNCENANVGFIISDLLKKNGSGPFSRCKLSLNPSGKLFNNIFS